MLSRGLCVYISFYMAVILVPSLPSDIKRLSVAVTCFHSTQLVALGKLVDRVVVGSGDNATTYSSHNPLRSPSRQSPSDNSSSLSSLSLSLSPPLSLSRALSPSARTQNLPHPTPQCLDRVSPPSSMKPKSAPRCNAKVRRCGEQNETNV